MSEYTITLTEDRLKVNFSATFINPRDCMITLHEVVYDSMGPREGFSIGDRLIAINDQFVCDMSIAEISEAFDRLQHPVMLTLSRCFDDDHSNLSTFKTNQLDRMYSYPVATLCRKSRRHYRRRTLSIDLQLDRGEEAGLTMSKYLQNLRNLFVKVFFDKLLINTRNKRIALVSSNGFSTGYHEWFIEVVKCDIFKQEIGVVGRCDVDEALIDDDFITGTTEFGARAVYGDDLQTDLVYYASFDEDGRQRCYKHLNGQIGLSAGDVVRVCLDLDHWRIRFLLNSVVVGKWMSLQPNKTYFPCISFTGNNQYAMR